MSAEEIDRLVAEAEQYKSEDDANRARVEAKNTFENYIFQLKSTVDKDGGKITPENKVIIETACKDATDWLNANQTAEKEAFEDNQKNLEKIALPIIQQMDNNSESMPKSNTSTEDTSVPDDGPSIEEID